MDEQIASEVKKAARATWSAGDFDEIAQLIWGVGPKLVERVGVGSSDRVLDIAAGTGNAALPAARAGAEVVASDLTPELFEAGRGHAAELGVELEWIEADAESLPFADESFDVVVSSFGIMFAPRHRVAAAEAARVLRPGGRLGFAAWRPDGRVGTFFRTIAGHMPPPPEDFQPPPMWGVPEHVEGLFDGSGIDLEFEFDSVGFEFDSAETATELYSTKFGPVVKAREALEPDGRWEALERDLIELFNAESEPTGDGSIRYVGEYTRILGTKSG